ncbi:MAG: putative peptidoglycan glycosyltransferase FtsW [Acutalibacteraceae bacterium]|nr:putative peptidoglycan glycosyltransferase FtsW [Acutalibacteraceae bacterium]
MENLRYVSSQRIKDHRRYTEEKARRKKEADGYEAEEARMRGSQKKKRFKLFSVRGGMDMPFFFLVLSLLVIGIVMMFSASYAFAYYTTESSYYFLIRQGVFALVGVTAMIGISFFDYHHLHRLAIIVLAIAYVMLIVVLFLPAVNGVHRWIGLGLFSIQPSEILKFAVILFYAHWASIYFEKMDTVKYGVLPALVVGVPAIGLLVLEPHFSCIVIIALLFAVMMFISGVKVRWFIIGIVCVALVFGVMYVTDSLQYAMERLDGWGMALEEELSAEMQATVWQTMNSLYAIGSGGLTGLGLGNSREKYLYLPEPQNDFVFAVVVEELGLIGGIIILAFFALFVWRGIMISLRAKDRFGMLLGVGLVSQIGLQVVLNILVITDTLPNTGISLPFFSYGGTSLVMLLAQMGIVLSISRSSNINKT